ncbi:MAG: leishmanolysin-related zinc metalloendopeptidase [Sphingomicrobium sp.]
MRNGEFGSSDRYVHDDSSAFGHARALDLHIDLPMTTDKVVGVDLTHVIHTSEVAAARGGGGGGGGGGGSSGGGTSYSPYTAGPANGASGYNITIEFKGTSWTQDLHDIFVNAANRLASLIVGELPDVTVFGKGGPKTIDDITITAELGNIDGLYGILGQAGPTAVRTGSSLPATAQMQFDIVDVNALGLTVFNEVVLHEMSHSLGFGSIWDRLGLVNNGLFTGTHAVEEYHHLGGAAAGVPVEQDGGSGTAGSHWDEETFGNELMTGYINDGMNYFTAMSAASFQDLGYTVAQGYGGAVDSGYILV